MLRILPPSREVTSLAIGHPHRDVALNRHVDHRMSFRTLSERRRWRVQGWPRCSRRSEKAPARQEQRAVRQRPAQRRNGRQHAVKSKVRKTSLVTVQLYRGVFFVSVGCTLKHCKLTQAKCSSVGEIAGQ